MRVRRCGTLAIALLAPVGCTSEDTSEPTASICSVDIPTVRSVGPARDSEMGELEAEEVRSLARLVEASDIAGLDDSDRAAVERFVAASEEYASKLDDSSTSADRLKLFLDDDVYYPALNEVEDVVARNC